jgi:hypothetical protein
MINKIGLTDRMWIYKGYTFLPLFIISKFFQLSITSKPRTTSQICLTKALSYEAEQPCIEYSHNKSKANLDWSNYDITEASFMQ